VFCFLKQLTDSLHKLLFTQKITRVVEALVERIELQPGFNFIKPFRPKFMHKTLKGSNVNMHIDYF
jgi:hypothetical protein